MRDEEFIYSETGSVLKHTFGHNSLAVKDIKKTVLGRTIYKWSLI